MSCYAKNSANSNSNSNKKHVPMHAYKANLPQKKLASYQPVKPHVSRLTG